MNIALYTGSKNKKTANRLLKKINADFSSENIEAFNNMDDFKRKIYSFPRKIDVAVLDLDDSQLSDLLQYRDALDGIEIILILPDQNKDTVSKGMSLYPRFLAYTDSDFDDVSAVLEKLSIKHRQENSPACGYIA